MFEYTNNLKNKKFSHFMIRALSFKLFLHQTTRTPKSRSPVINYRQPQPRNFDKEYPTNFAHDNTINPISIYIRATRNYESPNCVTLFCPSRENNSQKSPSSTFQIGLLSRRKTGAKNIADFHEITRWCGRDVFFSAFHPRSSFLMRDLSPVEQTFDYKPVSPAREKKEKIYPRL